MQIVYSNIQMQVWDAISDASITFGDETSQDDISYVVENGLVIDSVNKELNNIENVEVLYETKVKSYHLPENEEGKVNLCLENGLNYKCELLVSFNGSENENYIFIENYDCSKNDIFSHYAYNLSAAPYIQIFKLNTVQAFIKKKLKTLITSAMHSVKNIHLSQPTFNFTTELPAKYLKQLFSKK